MNTTKLIKNQTLEAENRKKRFDAQLRKVSIELYQRPLTRMQVSELTGIRIQNVCRYIAHLRKRNQVKVVYKGICPVTREANVEFLSTNPKFW